MKFSSENGYTLIEILVVMVLLAIAGSVVFVGVGKSMVNKQNRVFALEMISLCREARRMAVAHGVPTALHISSSQRRCWVNNGHKPLKIPARMLIEGEGITRLDKSEYVICFYPDGSSDGGDLTFHISGQPVYRFRVDILTGTIRRIKEDVCRPI